MGFFDFEQGIDFLPMRGLKVSGCDDATQNFLRELLPYIMRMFRGKAILGLV
jgi:hypothetical protein